MPERPRGGRRRGEMDEVEGKAGLSVGVGEDDASFRRETRERGSVGTKDGVVRSVMAT